MNVITLDDLRPQMIVQRGTELYQVSTVYENYVTATLVYPIPPRTTVCTITRTQLDRQAFTEPSAIQYSRYEQAWGFAR